MSGQPVALRGLDYTPKMFLGFVQITRVALEAYGEVQTLCVYPCGLFALQIAEKS